MEKMDEQSPMDIVSNNNSNSNGQSPMDIVSNSNSKKKKNTKKKRRRITKKKILQKKKTIKKHTYLDKIRTDRNKEFNKNRKPLDYLKMICSDTGVCISFGIETKRIRRFFDFENFNYITSIDIIGQPSVNGNIYELKYELDNYVAYTILKNSKRITADSLIYEYFVGTFINTKHMIYPCFLETYEIYKSNNVKFVSSTDLKNIIPSTNLNNPKNNIYKTLIDLACSDNSTEFSLLIQHIKNANGLQDCLDLKKKNIDKDSLYEFEIFFILFQIYFTLSELADSFTHYDLHLQNVLLYEPVNGSYIQYKYKLKNGKEINFKSKYIVKIIDYGRCFFSMNKNMSSLKVNDYICSIPNCNCGIGIGFNSISDNTKYCTNNYICSYKNNISHDLRLLYIINQLFAKHVPLLRNITEKVVYAKNYGTPELVDSGLPTKINNILDAFYLILETVQNPEIIEKNNIYYKNSSLLGNLNVYGGNTNMIFNKTK